MSAALVAVVPPWPKALGVALVIAVASLGATPAFAAPEWGITMTHANAYGLQAGECPGGKEESFPGEPERDCGVDPFTGSGTILDRESGFNAYTITVKNTGTETAGSYGVGETLGCVGGPSSGVSLTYQWLRNGAVISGASGASYQLQSADKGTAVQCKVTASSVEGATVAVSPSSLVAPIPSTLPPANGEATYGPPNGRVGETVTCETSRWTGSPTSYEFQWLRSGVPIAGASSGPVSSSEFAYTITAADLGKAIQCEVTATNADGSATAVNEFGFPSQFAPVAAPPVSSAAPTLSLSGTASVGETLSCSEGAWENSPTSYGYQWLRGGTPISGATSHEYTLVAADAAKAVQCQVVAANAEGATSAVSSQDVVSPGPTPTAPTNTEAPGVFGYPLAPGKTVECHPGSWEEEPASYEFQYLRNGAPIAGASGRLSASETKFGETGLAYTLTTADAEKAIQCEVTPTNAGGSVTAISGARIVPPELANASAMIPTQSVSVSDQLPAGLVLAGKETGDELSGSGWNCPIANPSRVTCATSERLAAGASYPPITLHVYVNEGAPDTVTNWASVSGGGASPATATASDPTTIATVPFGIQSFTTSVTEALGNPFTQAGGHPFAAGAMFVFNYVPDAEGNLKDAGGSPKDIETELPPGFVGSPQTLPKCPVGTFEAKNLLTPETPCPSDTAVGYIQFSYLQGTIAGGHAEPLPSSAPSDTLYNLATSHYPAAFGFIGNKSGGHYTLVAKVRSDGDYGITVGSPFTATPTLLAAKLTFCENGVTEEGPSYDLTQSCTPVAAGSKPFLTSPTQCSSSAPVTTLSANSYEEPAYASMTSYTGAPSAAPAFAGGAMSQANPVASSFLTGCNLLQFNPKFEFEPETTEAGQPTGMAVDLKVPQTNEPSVSATPELKDATVTLPEGMSVSPSAVEGLQACSDAQFGLGSSVEPAVPATCSLSSQLATVRIVSPLLEKPLEGQVFLGQPECSPCTTQDAQEGHIFRLFLQAQGSGVIVKVFGRVSANPVTGRLTASFENQPQLPFNVLELKFKGGPRAPLANPQSCGEAIVGWDMTPWSAPGLGGLSGTEAIAGTPDAIAQEPSFTLDWDGHGGACPGRLPFGPSFVAGTASSAAGAYSDFAVIFGRPEPARESEERDEQNLAGITVVTPSGLLGKLSGVQLCEEPQAGAGSCSAASQIGTVTAGAGSGSHPFYVDGRVYLTGPYKGEPFGLSIVVPAVAGPFNLGTVVVRASITVNPSDAHLTIASDPFPQIVDGVPLRLHKIRVEVNRPEFILNPTNCAAQAIQATITGEHVKAGETNAGVGVATPFVAGGCKSLAFNPSFAVSTQGKTSKADGASLTADLSYPAASPGRQADIAKVKVELPKALPSRLTTLQKACTNAQFEANPAGCPAESKIGSATVNTPILPVPLSGPAIFVSHGGEAFPSLTLVLQGDNVTIDLVGTTFISKAGVTSTTFKTVPDAPFSTFALTLPEGPYSALAANGNLCAQKLTMPTEFIAQNGVAILQQTKVAVTGCKASKPSVKITKTGLKRDSLLVTIKTSVNGTIRISGNDFKTTVKKNVEAGSHQIKVALSKTGKTAKKRREKTKLRASLTVSKQAVTKTTSVKL